MDPLGYLLPCGFEEIVKESRKKIVEWDKINYELDGVSLQTLQYKNVRDVKEFYHRECSGVCYDEEFLDKLAYSDMNQIINLKLGKLTIGKKYKPMNIDESLVHDVLKEGRDEECRERQSTPERDHVDGRDVSCVQEERVQDSEEVN